MNSRLPWFLNGFLLLLGLILGYWSWSQSQKATIVVEWSTASELDTVGFNVYRSEIDEGPYVQVNKNLIAASADPLTGGSYVYDDQEVLPGRRYYYQLEDVDQTGQTSRHGPIEVDAKGGGKAELILALACSMIGVIGMVRLKANRLAEDLDEPVVQLDVTEMPSSNLPNTNPDAENLPFADERPAP